MRRLALIPGSRWLVLATLVAYAALTLVLSCASGRDGVPVQSWWKSRGPVVPHEKFPADCSLCHDGKGWTAIRADFVFDHAKETGVALEGAHAQAECLRCHNDRGPVAMFAARGCSGCHEDPHRTQMGPDCKTCHDERTWRPGELIATHARTRFPLVGAHAVAACWQCHPGAQTGNFARVDTSCEACHQQDLARATNPDHAAQGWTNDCQRCHIPIQWGGASFTHSVFPLTGAHTGALCADCHGMPPTYNGTPNQCVDCHLADYNSASSPNHVTFNFSTDCAQCHSTSTWQGAQFNHVGITSGCVTCHQAEYNATTSPNHATYNISTSCEQCHGTSTWEGAQFNHVGITNGCVSCHLPDYQGSSNPDHTLYGFPQTCEQCHSTSNWTVTNFAHTGITNGCSNCHMPDYQATVDPNHTAAGFSTTCEQCHTSTSNWLQDNWPHPDFPIHSGKHNGFACADCHLQPPNYASFSCTHCHEHRQSKMASEHQGVNGYSWSSPACYQCHPDGQD